jgi:hypothetical protein
MKFTLASSHFGKRAAKATVWLEKSRWERKHFANSMGNG